MSDQNNGRGRAEGRSGIGSETLAFANHIRAFDVLRQVVSALEPMGIQVMPLKGVLFRATVYDPPWSRPMSDIDVLVPEARVGDSLAALRGIGWQCIPSPRDGGQAIPNHGGFSVDLHGALFPPYMFRMPTSELFRRSRSDSDLFGCRVQIADTYDTYAHLVGHFAKDRRTAEDAVGIGDLARVPAAYGLIAERCAGYLDEYGLGRAARYSLTIAASTGDRFSAKVLSALRRDRTGDKIAAGARWFMERQPLGYKAGAVAAHLLNRNLVTAACSLASNLALIVRRRRG